MASYENLSEKLRKAAAFRGPEDAPSAPCPEAELLRKFVEGELESEKEREIARHVAACAQCARTLAAWDTIEKRDEMLFRKLCRRAAAAEFRTAPSRVARWVGRQVTTKPRFAFGLGGAALAAAILLALVLPVLFAPSEGSFEVRLVASTGTVRAGGNVFSPREQLHLELTLPRAAYVYVVCLHGKEPTIVYPEGKPEKLSGKVEIPGEDSAWTDFDPGSYTVLVGAAPEPLSAQRRTELLNALKETGSPLEKAAPFFSRTELISFRIE